MKLIKEIRENSPLIHCLTNNVVKNFTANGLLAFGASPIMAEHPGEVSEVVKISDALLINIGTILPDNVATMIYAGQVANDHQIPVVLDPVGVGASKIRKTIADELLEAIQFSVIKGNAGEIATLAGASDTTKGVDSNHVALSLTEKYVYEVAQQHKSITVATGERDFISDGETTLTNRSGVPMLTRVTGTGCLLGAIIGAALSTNAEPIKAVANVVHFYGQAAENALALSNVQGPGTFQAYFLDELAR